MKKLLFSFALLFMFSSFQAFSASLEDFSLAVEPLFGLRYGQLDEYVFLKESNYSDDKLSELNWELKPELYYGLKVHGGWKDFFAETTLSFGIPMKTGLMKDSDWFNSQTYAVTTANAAGHDYKTCYSEHDNHLDYDINFNFKGGYQFLIRDFVNIKPAFAFDYENIKFTGIAGQGLYGNSISNNYWAAYNDKSNNGLMKFSGRVITYRRELYLLWLGSDFSVKLPRNFTVSTGFFFAPYVHALSFDSHLTKDVDYADKTTGFFGAFKWNLGAEYQIDKRQSVLLNASYFYMRVIRGDNYSKVSTKSSYDKSTLVDGGAGAKYIDVNLSYRFKIF